MPGGHHPVILFCVRQGDLKCKQTSELIRSAGSASKQNETSHKLTASFGHWATKLKLFHAIYIITKMCYCSVDLSQFKLKFSLYPIY